MLANIFRENTFTPSELTGARYQAPSRYQHTRIRETAQIKRNSPQEVWQKKQSSVPVT
jgi:hypothetical protein